MISRLVVVKSRGRSIRPPNREFNVTTKGGTHDGYVFLATYNQYFFHCA